ncbi:outer membrane protein assembly factor BamC [Chitinibacter bivalviorum]|uniref:Outer membrane protein assembly factor BamC n=1 Tax=Chitinibacter bivalviorum TaxID=2739434 RepID=A0A7H9BHU0_9NEIS|nr:outer membrane protein assembly factor BamC [Chitinibacter bivalviorum]QLG87511.1 outer membrane protein assembly factor BamC [Chitinibacter bivalviorum]
MNSKVDYRSASDNLNKNPLEIPPDLTTVQANPQYAYSSPNTALATQNANTQRNDEGQKVLPEYKNARIVSHDGIRYIEVNGSTSKTWDDIKDFWLANGFLLTIDNPTIGVMETDWLENRANLPVDLATRLFRKLVDQFVSTNSLDKYRTRIERSATPGVVNIYVTHRGMTEVYKEGGAQQSETWNGTAWTPSPPNPELEAEIMGMMLQNLGMTKEEAKAASSKPEIKVQSRAALSASGQEIEIVDNYDRAWRRVGLAFDRIGYNVQDKNRSTGVYTVQRAATDIDKESESNYFSSLTFWKKSKSDNPSAPTSQVFEVTLSEKLNQTVLSISSKEGAIDPAVQKKMLNDLLLQLK